MKLATTSEDRAFGRSRLRSKNMCWESPREARDFYARYIAHEVACGVEPTAALVYAYAAADRLVRWQWMESAP